MSRSDRGEAAAGAKHASEIGVGSSRAPRLQALVTSVAAQLGDQIVDVKPFREGVDCYVDEVVLSDGRRAVLRSAKYERRETTYDGLVDAGEDLVRELAAAELFREAGGLAPAVLAWSRATPGTAERSWTLTELIEHTPVAAIDADIQIQLGEIARRFHNIQPVGISGRMVSPWDVWEEWVVDRIMRRVDAARTYVNLPDGARIRDRLSEVIAGRGAHATRLLHLDLRPPNVAVCEGQVVAVFDFGNAICGDPYLELARIRQCDLLTPAFQKGYGITGEELGARAELLCAYALDLTALLVVVSREEFDDPVLHREMSERTHSLISTLLA